MKKKWKIILAIVFVLILIRIALPFIVKKYVNRTLDQMEGYYGNVADIDLNLFRGAYVIKELNIIQSGDSIPVPFLQVDRVDLSIHWKALLSGSIAGEVILTGPVLNFAVAESNSDNETVSQDGSEADWNKTLKELMPIQINRFEIIQGEINYKDFSSNPKVDIYLQDLNLLATNLSNVKDKGVQLPSSLSLQAKSIGGGDLKVKAGLNVLKKIPDFDIDFQFEGVELVALNDFVKAYTKTDIEEGTFSLYAELAAEDGAMEGYVKPVIENLKVLDWQNENDHFINKVWQSIVGLATELFKNHPKDQVATQTPIKGNLNDLKVGVWPTVWNIFKNAFIQALSKQVENTVNLSETTPPQEED